MLAPFVGIAIAGLVLIPQLGAERLHDEPVTLRHPLLDQFEDFLR
jgi:hypothetical protein